MKKIQINSQDIRDGDIFIAIKCKDVEKNINQALSNGVSIVVLEKNSVSFSDNRFIYTDDARLAASKFAAFCYDGLPEHCLSVTGTNGKSSVVHFLSEIWSHIGINNANLGTNGLFVNGNENKEIYVQPLTTPDCINLHQILSFLASKDITHFAFEASSHAIDQKRLHSVPLKVAAFTNLGLDHLDYHHTKEEYFATKQKLFTEIHPKKTVFSMDDDHVFNILKTLHNDYITFGFSSKNDIYATNIREFPNKVIIDLCCKGDIFKDVSINIFGTFQTLNILCAIAMATADGIPINKITESLSKIKILSGRMEYISSKNGANIYVDYAHTANGFENALKVFRKNCKGKLIIVFGCGGDRDKSKRSLMGKIAGKISDIKIITDDNPRTEDPAKIRKEIIKNCIQAIEIPSRAEAIKYAISVLQPGDTLAIIGKGHETVQIYKDKTIKHNDKECILTNV